ncbi:MAG: hypothetical protein ABR962_05920 [Candidatus Bathyarchaeia archaeon]|jgi:hypothetical protein
MPKDEITKGILELLTEIAKNEKQKAVKRSDYFDASVAQLFESMLKDARNSMN